MTNSKYWEKRIANATLKTYNTLEEKNIALLEMYENANKSIREELYKLYEKSKATGLMQSEEYARQHLNRLRLTYQKKIEQLYDDVYHSSKENMKNGYSSVYQNVEQQIGKTSFVLPNDKVMEKNLEKSWRGGNFSSRLWKNKEKLNNALDGIFLTGISTGSSVSEMAVKLSKAMQSGFQDAHRLVRTETMHYLNEAALNGYKDSGVSWVQFYAAEDERMCDTCGKYHGRYYRIDKCPVLPLHPNCRCTILPVVDEKKIAELENLEEQWNGPAGNDIMKKHGSMKMNLQFFAKIPEEKFTKYALDFHNAPDKAIAFRDALGYTKENYKDLIQNIEDNLDKSLLVNKGDKGYGTLYEYVMKLKGANGKKANVLTAWISDKDDIRLISAYVTKKKETK